MALQRPHSLRGEEILGNEFIISIANLESETQKVSQAILRLQGSVERLHAVIGDDGDGTCASALQNIFALMAQSQTGSTSVAAGSNEMNGSPVAGGGGGRKSKYGLVPEAD